MESFLHEQNLKLLRRHLVASNPTKIGDDATCF